MCREPTPDALARNGGKVTDLTWMRRCLELAREAKAEGETAVGAVVVRDGSIVGEGRERTRASLDPTAHAEIEAIRAACRRLGSRRLDRCVLYTTVEPCILCSYAVRATGLAEVCYGVRAGDVGGHGGSTTPVPHPVLTSRKISSWGPPPKVQAGLLEEEARTLLKRTDQA